jgi:hypothetical protein
MKTLGIAAALGVSLLLVFAWQAGDGAPSASTASPSGGSCYAEGPGPEEPTLCS